MKTSLPDAARHDPCAEYLRGLIESTKLSQRAVAARIGVSFRMLQYYLTSPYSGKRYEVAPYPVQYAIERLAAQGEPHV